MAHYRLYGRYGTTKYYSTDTQLVNDLTKSSRSGSNLGCFVLRLNHGSTVRNFLSTVPAECRFLKGSIGWPKRPKKRFLTT